MRFLPALLVVASLGACASTPSSTRSGSVNVAAIRHEIADTIHGDRAIVSMGHVERDKAIVFTESKDKARHQEIWVRGDAGRWTLSGSDVAAQ